MLGFVSINIRTSQLPITDKQSHLYPLPLLYFIYKLQSLLLIFYMVMLRYCFDSKWNINLLRLSSLWSVREWDGEIKDLSCFDLSFSNVGGMLHQIIWVTAFPTQFYLIYMIDKLCSDRSCCWAISALYIVEWKPRLRHAKFCMNICSLQLSIFRGYKIVRICLL